MQHAVAIKKFICNAFLMLILPACSHLPFSSQSGSNGEDSMIGVGVVSISSLESRDFSATLNFEKVVYQRELYRGELYSYFADGLKQYTLVNTPSSSPPEDGYPVLIFGHGFHPEPSQYGITKSGEVSRPGDYYRGIPESFAKRGFLVLSPDYRGHNISQGSHFTNMSYLATSYYASDILHVLAGLQSLQHSNLNRVYYLGHSMGGEVGLKVMLASDAIRAASLWSPVSATTDIQALHYGKLYDKTLAPDDAKVDNNIYNFYRQKINAVYADFSTNVDIHAVDPIHYVTEIKTPLIIQHSRRDTVVPYAWSEILLVELMNAGKAVQFHTYDTDNHLFNQENMKKAIERDISFFDVHQ